MLKGFKEFIMRGNVIDLAVAVVIGAAFTSIVNALVDGIFNPAIAALFDAASLKDVAKVTIPSTTGEPAVLLFGAVIAAVIQFILVAAVVYFVLVMPINHMRKRAEARRKAGVEEPEAAPPADIALLTEIRDLLRGTEAARASGVEHPGVHPADHKHIAE